MAMEKNSKKILAYLTKKAVEQGCTDIKILVRIQVLIAVLKLLMTRIKEFKIVFCFIK